MFFNHFIIHKYDDISHTAIHKHSMQTNYAIEKATSDAPHIGIQFIYVVFKDARFYHFHLIQSTYTIPMLFITSRKANSEWIFVYSMCICIFMKHRMNVCYIFRSIPFCSI